MPFKRIFASLVVLVVAISGFVAGLMLLQERQNLNEQAAVPGGQATVTVSPATGTYELGDTIKASVYFQTANIPVSGVAVRMTYPYTGVSPEVSVSSISVNSTFLSSGSWTCPTQNSSLQGGNVVIDIACGNQSALGFATNTNTLLGTVDLKIERAPSDSPFVIRFDPTQSIITRKSNNQDILLIPTSVGSYTISGAQQTTPTPTIVEEDEASPTPTKKTTGTVTTTPTKAQIADAGFSTPTLFGLLAGIILIAGALLLAL